LLILDIFNLMLSKLDWWHLLKFISLDLRKVNFSKNFVV
jgi:hypothetical protein